MSLHAAHMCIVAGRTCIAHAHMYIAIVRISSKPPHKQTHGLNSRHLSIIMLLQSQVSIIILGHLGLALIRLLLIFLFIPLLFSFIQLLGLLIDRRCVIDLCVRPTILTLGISTHRSRA